MKIKVGVFFGGRSVEHEVSIVSAMQAVAALDKTKYQAIPVYMTKDGRFFTGEGFDRVENYRDGKALLEGGAQVALIRDNDSVILLRHPARKLRASVLDRLDVALPVAHGSNGEDGTLSGLFESLGLPYAGCDVFSSAACMNKSACKTLLSAADIPVLPHKIFTGREISGDPSVCRQIEDAFGYPVAVKPNNLGSSIGIGIARDRAALQSALELAARFSERVLAEPAIEDLTEINCAVLGNAYQALPSVCERPVGSDEILSYQDKYLNNGGGKGMAQAKRQIPADIPDALAQEIQKMAVKAFQTLGCGGVARIDFMLDKDKIYLNEINNIPGSLAFYLFEPAGIPFPKLLDQLIDLAFQRQRDNAALHFTFENNLLANVHLGGMKK